MKEKIIKLTELWYRIVGLDHHKDRDCHWYINTVYSYGQPPIYRVEHYGYIHEDVDYDYDTYEEAEKSMAEELEDAVREKNDWAIEVLKKPESWDEYQVENAKKIVELTAEWLAPKT